MSSPRHRPSPPPGTMAVTVPGDMVLVRAPGLVIWAGALSAFPKGFAFTLLMLFDSRQADPPEGWALDRQHRGRQTWLSARHADGRYLTDDWRPNIPDDQQAFLMLQDGESSWTDTEGWNISRWWATPLPPAGPVELAIHLNGASDPTGHGHLDGTALAEAGRRADVVWLDRR